jgi:anti-sigma factor RsiW
VDYLRGRRVAVVVFRRRAHLINVFVAPHKPEFGVERGWRRNGYNVVHGRNGDFDFWAVSDLNAPELGVVAELLGNA